MYTRTFFFFFFFCFFHIPSTQKLFNSTERRYCWSLFPFRNLFIFLLIFLLLLLLCACVFILFSYIVNNNRNSTDYTSRIRIVGETLNAIPMRRLWVIGLSAGCFLFECDNGARLYFFDEKCLEMKYCWLMNILLFRSNFHKSTKVLQSLKKYCKPHSSEKMNEFFLFIEKYFLMKKVRSTDA